MNANPSNQSTTVTKSTRVGLFPASFASTTIMAVTVTAAELDKPMVWCLRTPELVTLICDEADKSSALALALTCKRFLEPGLNSRWRHITSFGPLVACLPEDLLEERNLESRGLRSKMKTFRRALHASDLQRYLEFYAQRILSFRPHPQDGKMWLSIEALQAIQVITAFIPGVLSPRLKAFQLTPPGRRTLVYLERGFANRLSPCMALFISRNVTRMEFSSFYDQPLYCSAVGAFTSSIPNLENLEIRVHREHHPSYGATKLGNPFLQQYLTSSPWSNLKELTMLDGGQWVYVSSATLQHLSTLPQLSTLNVDGHVECGSPGHAPPNNDGFPSLRRVSLGGSNIFSILRFLPATNRVNSVNCRCFLPRQERAVLAAIGMHCNPLTLRELQLTGRYAVSESYLLSSRNEGLEPPDGSDDIDIEPLLQFQLEFVDIRVSNNIRITPAQMALLCSRWRSATHIHFFSLATTTSNPCIDHSHVVAIAKNCPALTHLGLRFDASRIKGDTMVPAFDHARHLRTMYVGDSPIYSPAAVLRFLGIVFPFLEAVGYRSPCEWDIPIYKNRWNAVADRYTEISEAL